MSLPQKKYITLEEFYRMRESAENLLEYIDGAVWISPSPSTTHQRISGKLYVKLYSLLEGKGCEVFSAPYDIQLHLEHIKEDKVVIPDISVICDKKGIQESKFVGVPTLIIEIVSPSNQANDLVVKLNLYMNYGVCEYWIVNPILNTIQVYYLNCDKLYEQIAAAKDSGVVTSKTFPDFSVELDEIFY
jgi:Uma2 family endonuclease